MQMNALTRIVDSRSQWKVMQIKTS